MAESEEELTNLLMKVKVESEKVGLKLNIQKTKIMASGPITPTSPAIFGPLSTKRCCIFKENLFSLSVWQRPVPWPPRTSSPGSVSMSVLGVCITTLEHLQQNPIQREVGIPLACSLKKKTHNFFFILKFYLCIYFLTTAWLVGSEFLDQGSNPCPL